jgi:hypothetical protein
MSYHKDNLAAFSPPASSAKQLNELPQRKLSEPELARLKRELGGRSPEREAKEIKLVKGIATSLNLEPRDMARMLNLRSADTLGLAELPRGLDVSGDVEERIRLLFEIIATTAALVGKTGNHPAVREYLDRQGYLCQMKEGTFAALLEVRWLLFNLSGGVWGRRNAEKVARQT